MKLETLKDLYIHELKDLYSAEKQIIKALPKMVKAATNKQLAAGFEEHFEQTKEHVARLEQILTSYDESTRGPKCQGMEGLIKEGEEMIEEDAEEEVRDAGLIAAAQRVEHYEMAGYGCARTYAELLGDPDSAQLLQTTLTEESDTDEKLTDLAKSVINLRAQINNNRWACGLRSVIPPPTNSNERKPMKRTLLALTCLSAVSVAALAADDKKVNPDNTAKNERDRSGETQTSGDQSNSSADLKITQAIRQALMKDGELSTTAKNIKVITANGQVTLRGPVKTAQEKAKIDQIAKSAAGGAQIDGSTTK